MPNSGIPILSQPCWSPTANARKPRRASTVYACRPVAGNYSAIRSLIQASRSGVGDRRKATLCILLRKRLQCLLCPGENQCFADAF